MGACDAVEGRYVGQVAIGWEVAGILAAAATGVAVGAGHGFIGWYWELYAKAAGMEGDALYKGCLASISWLSQLKGHDTHKTGCAPTGVLCEA
jgi:hypothetical protein